MFCIYILKIRGIEVIREAGFVMRLSKFEAMFDIFLIIGIILFFLTKYFSRKIKTKDSFLVANRKLN